MPAETSGMPPKTQFPKPRTKYSQDTARGKNAWKFFEYWQSLKPAHAELCETWWYRCWPEIDVKIVQPDIDSVSIQMIAGPCPFKEPQGYEQFLHEAGWAGAGDYRVDLVETGVPGCIARAYISIRDQLDSYPPKLDYRTVLVDAPANAYYVQWCGRNNIALPKSTKRASLVEGGEEFQMGSMVGDAFKTLAESNSKLTERSIEQAERLAEARIEALEPEPSNVRDTAISESIGLVTHTAKQMVEMVTQHSGKQYDPVELLKTTAEVLGNNKGDSGESGMNQTLTLFIGTIEKSNDRTMAILDKQNDTLRTILTARQDSGGVPNAPQKTLLEQMKEAREMMDLFGFKRGGGGETSIAPAAAPQQSWFNESTAPIVMLGFQTGMVLLSNMVYNWSCAKFRNPGQEPVEPGAAMRQASQMTVQMQQQNGAAPSAAPNPQEEHKAQMQAFIEEFTQPFIAHFFDATDATGYGLAHFLQSDGTMKGFTPAGRQNYMALRDKIGRKQFDLLVRGHTPLWSKVQGEPQRYQKFLDEFFGYDQWAADRAAKAKAAAAPEPETTSVS